MDIVGTEGAALSPSESESALAGKETCWRILLPSRLGVSLGSGTGVRLFCVRPRDSLRGGGSTTTGGGGCGKADRVKTELEDSAEWCEGRAGGDLAATGAGAAMGWRGCANDGGRGNADSVKTELSDMPEGGGVASAGES